MIGVEALCIVERDAKRLRQGAEYFFLIELLRERNTLENGGEKISRRALAGIAADLLAVQAGCNANAVRFIGYGSEGCIDACQVVETGRREEFIVFPPKIGLLSACRIEVIGDGVIEKRIEIALAE